MSEHFIKYIDIDSFKCFRDFSSKGFKRVNLVAGKNNIGKTAFLESLLLNILGVKAAHVLFWLFGQYYDRRKGNYIGKAVDRDAVFQELIGSLKYIKQTSNINSIALEAVNSDILGDYNIFTTQGGGETASIYDLKSGIVSIKDYKVEASFIGSFGASQEEIRKSFVNIQKKDRESDLYAFVKQLDDSIENVKIIGEKIQCKVADFNGESSYRDLYEFGDGLRQYLSIIVDLYASGNGYLFIDEVDNGIHYSSLDKLWEIILTLSKEMNVQVFATTHSRECIESYCRVAEKFNDQDISFITLVKNKDKQIKAIVRDFDIFTNSIHEAREVRGW